MIKKLVVIFACLAVAAVASSDTFRVTLFQSSMVGGKELKPGDYKIELKDSTVVISQGKQSVEAQVKVENGDQNFSATSVRYLNAEGKYKIQEIRLGGTKTKLVFAN